MITLLDCSYIAFVYHCFDRIVIQGYLPLLSRSEYIVYFFRDVHGIYPITPQALAKRTPEYQAMGAGLRPQAPAQSAPDSSQQQFRFFRT